MHYKAPCSNHNLNIYLLLCFDFFHCLFDSVLSHKLYSNLTNPQRKMFNWCLINNSNKTSKNPRTRGWSQNDCLCRLWLQKMNWSCLWCFAVMVTEASTKLHRSVWAEGGQHVAVSDCFMLIKLRSLSCRRIKTTPKPELKPNCWHYVDIDLIHQRKTPAVQKALAVNS